MFTLRSTSTLSKALCKHSTTDSLLTGTPSKRRKKVSVLPIHIVAIRSHHYHLLCHVSSYSIIIRISFQDGGSSGDEGHSFENSTLHIFAVRFMERVWLDILTCSNKFMYSNNTIFLWITVNKSTNGVWEKSENITKVLPREKSENITKMLPKYLLLISLYFQQCKSIQKCHWRTQQISVPVCVQLTSCQATEI